VFGMPRNTEQQTANMVAFLDKFGQPEPKPRPATLPTPSPKKVIGANPLKRFLK
jgi:hypothetical protein